MRPALPTLLLAILSSANVLQLFRQSQILEPAQKYAYQCRMEFLTTSEAADYLRIGERKLYELIAQE
ncbi:helix-turn-helix domain-containing protein, partial [Mesorhizobium sp. M7A.F.Ca.US.007.01.1.1]|uniref:helix-turn-helix domain-containing protein n=1 Tax=Mesorhizobium sp. M7A.F.Ca.US.007.01.1.1 TaxID=2496712 RepID=UPI001FE118E3